MLQALTVKEKSILQSNMITKRVGVILIPTRLLRYRQTRAENQLFFYGSGERIRTLNDGVRAPQCFIQNANFRQLHIDNNLDMDVRVLKTMYRNILV